MAKKELIIVGAGMVGALAALLLAKQGHIIHIVEKTPCKPLHENSDFDLRVSAFSMQSKQLLDAAGVWDLLPEKRVCGYQKLQTWEAGSTKLKFDSTDIGVDLLGYIIENRCIQTALWQALKTLKNVTFYENREVKRVDNSDATVSVILDNDLSVSADLLLACDGANSAIRQSLNIGITAWDYRQKCMLINIKTACEQQDITWQEFRETGPCAFLPLAGNNASLVWYHNPQKIDQLLSLSNEALQEKIKEEFATLAFDFEVVNKAAFSLTRQHAQDYYKGSVVLLGDAAHSINPLAGQGVNLGFKDVACLVKLLKEQESAPMQALLKRYQQQRKPANLLMQSAMDIFYKSSKCELSAVRLLRKGILTLAQNSGPLKNRVMKYAMGLE